MPNEPEQQDPETCLACERCGSTVEVHRTADPYALEIWDDDTQYCLCNECYQDRLWDI